MYEYLATVLKVVDGDTLHLSADLGFGVTYGSYGEPLIVRLYGLDAPELNTDAGKVAKQFVIDWLNSHAIVEGVHVTETAWQVIVRTYKDKKEKYGRYLAEILDTTSYGNSLNRALLDSGNAVKYPSILGNPLHLPPVEE